MKKSRFNGRRFASLIRKEFIQIIRDKFSLMAPIIMPIAFMVLFGCAINSEITHMETAVCDQSKTQESRAYIEAFAYTGYFDMNYYANSEKEVSDLVHSGRAKVGIVIPIDFAKEIKKGNESRSLIIIDGTDPTIARTARNCAELITMNFSRNNRLVNPAVIKAASSITASINVLFNPNMDSFLFSIPGVIAVIMQNITIMLTAFAMVREKERGTMEQLIVTPVKPLELILAKLIPYILIGYVGFLFTLALGRIGFGLKIQGSLGLLLGCGAMFVICALMIGMLISTVTRTQTQAMQSMIIVLLPSIILSGFMFPIDAMPSWLRPFSALLPLTYFLRIERGIMLKSIGLEYLWPEMLVLLFMTVILILISMKRFRKSLD